MKDIIKKIPPLVILIIFLLPLAIIIAAVPQSSINKNEVISPDQLLQTFNDGVQYMNSDEIADALVQKDPTFVLIDVRTVEEYNEFHLPHAINIPLHDILSDQWRDVLDQDVYTNVFYSTGTVNANQAWMMCQLKGYKNNYVLQGGLNNWAETIMNPTKPLQTASDDEIAKYNFRNAANAALGGGKLEQSQSATPSSSGSKPVIQMQKKKKRASGGCS